MTFNEIIASAYRRITVTQTGTNPDANEYAVGLERFNLMASGWRNQGLQMDFSWVDVADGGTTALFPGEDLEAIINNLAMSLAPDYGKQVPKWVADAAAQGWSGLYQKYYTGPEARVDTALLPSRMPGRRWYGRGGF